MGKWWKEKEEERGPVAFVQVPKTATASVHAALAGRCVEITHSPTERLSAAGFRRDNPRAFIFAFVRNPFDRLLSAYSYLSMRHQDAALAEARRKYIEPYAGFRDLVLGGVGDGRVTGWTHFRPQVSWLSGPGGVVVADWLGRYERLQGDFDSLCRLMGWPEARLPVVHKSVHADYRECYDAEMEAVVARAYARDFDAGGYEKVVGL